MKTSVRDELLVISKKRGMRLTINYQKLRSLFVNKMRYYSWKEIVTDCSDDFIEEFIEELDLNHLIYNRQLTIEFIEEKIIPILLNSSKDNTTAWHYLFSQQKLTEEFIENYIDKIPASSNYGNGGVYWEIISRCQKLSEYFINKHKEKVSWENITRYQTLSQFFIETHVDKIDWDLVAEYQKVDGPFLLHNAKKINWHGILQEKKLCNKLIGNMLFWTYKQLYK